MDVEQRVVVEAMDIEVRELYRDANIFTKLGCKLTAKLLLNEIEDYLRLAHDLGYIPEETKDKWRDLRFQGFKRIGLRKVFYYGLIGAA